MVAIWDIWKVGSSKLKQNFDSFKFIFNYLTFLYFCFTQELTQNVQ